jgi:AraC family transcriptional regulator
MMKKRNRPKLSDSLQLEFRHGLVRPDIERRLQFRGISLEYARVTSATEYAFKMESANHYLALHDLVMEVGEMDIEGCPTILGGDIRDTMTYVPAGRPLSGWSKTTGRQNSFMILHFDPVLVSEETERVLESGDAEPLVYFEDQSLLRTMDKLESVIADGLDHPSIYVETLALLATLELSKLQTTAFRGNDRTGRLSKPQELLLRDYIEANLTTDISLEDLAQLTQLSRFHLARRFKASFGHPPHQYITGRRMEFAKRLLREPALPVGEVATAVGYSSPGPFIKAFKQLVGKTPAAFKRG